MDVLFALVCPVSATCTCFSVLSWQLFSDQLRIKYLGPRLRSYYHRLRGMMVQGLRMWRCAEIGELHLAVGCLAPPSCQTKILTVIRPPV